MMEPASRDSVAGREADRGPSSGNGVRAVLALSLAGLFSCLLVACSVVGLDNGGPPPREATVHGLSFTLSAGQPICTPASGPDTAATCLSPDIEGVLSARNLTDTTVRAFRPSGSRGTSFALSLYREGWWGRPAAGYDLRKDYGSVICLQADFFVTTRPGETGEVSEDLRAPSLEPGPYRLVAVFPNPLCHRGPYVRVAAPDPVIIGTSQPFDMSQVDFAPVLGVDLSKMTDLGDQLYIQTLQTGVGDTRAAPGDSLTVDYELWLPDGTKVESTRDRGGPLELRLGADNLVDGFQMGVAGMLAGETRRILVPPALGYGSRSVGTLIPQNSVLVYDVELLSLRRPS